MIFLPRVYGQNSAIFDKFVGVFFVFCLVVPVLVDLS